MENQEQIIVPTTPILPASPTKNYTQIENAVCDIKTARILKGLLSGRHGELTNLNNLLFGSILATSNNDFLKVLNNLLNDSLIHSRLLGNAINLFGFCPRFTNGQGAFWTARNVSYITDRNNFINSNINHINRQILELEQAITKISNESLKSLLGEIILDKKSHLEIFNSLLN